MHQYTLNLPLEGYEQLEVTHDLGMTQREIYAARLAGQPAPTIVDFPNWEQVAALIGLTAFDEATGTRNGRALEKPALPLTAEAMIDLDLLLVNYLSSDDAITDALEHHREQRRPFSNRRSPNSS